MTAPCRGCEDRTPECHCTCERYAAYAKEREEIRRKRKEEADINYAHMARRNAAAIIKARKKQRGG